MSNFKKLRKKNKLSPASFELMIFGPLAEQS